jgi:hypothetical protein
LRLAQTKPLLSGFFIGGNRNLPLCNLPRRPANYHFAGIVWHNLTDAASVSKRCFGILIELGGFEYEYGQCKNACS